ncbi:hypothetical protein [Sphaerimonospora mesophila]|uniref:hypothetical protein n=1 Tax=Sphaerimonospora mesophila TaxID=37483 RepID=UPI0006E1E817
MKEDAKIFNQEKAILLGGPRDLDDRVLNLGKVVDKCDRDWTFDFARRGEQVVRILRGKHPRAHQTSPIHITVEHSLSEDSELSKQIRRTLGYGTDEKVVLPAEIVERLTIDGPEWLSETVEHVHVELLPHTMPSDQEVRMELRILDNNGRALASHHAKVQHGNTGYEGRCLKATFYNVAELVFMFPHDEEQPTTLSYAYTVAETSPSDLLRAMRLIKQLHETCTGEIYLNGQRLGVIGFTAKDHFAEVRAHLDEIRRCEQLAEDLDIVQRHCDNFFPVPAELSGIERAALRMVRLLIEGKCAVHPTARLLTATLTGSGSEELRVILSGNPQSLRLDLSGCTVDIAGHELLIGDVMLFHTRVIAVNAGQVLEALDAGSAEGCVLKLQPEGEDHFHAFIPAKWPGNHMPVVPTPWGLPELVEPAARTESVA